MRRGLLYLGCGEIRSDLPAVRAFDELPADCSIRVYLLGRRADVESNPWATPVFLDSEAKIASHEFLLLVTENVSCLVQLRVGARRHAPQVRVMHLMEVLDAAVRAAAAGAGPAT